MHKIVLRFVVVITISVASSATARPRSDPSFSAEVDRYIEKARREWGIPGAAIAVVRDGHIVTAKGYGVRELGRPGHVDGDTLFDAASLTKAFTAAAIASLVDEKRMSWDEPVRRYLPALEFPDPFLTANVTVRDLLCHRTGVRPTHSSWFFTGVSRPRLMEMVKSMEMAAPFRAKFVYSNVGYAVAGQAAAAAAGTSWEDLVTSRLLMPLGMRRSTADWLGAPAAGNIAIGHSILAEGLRAIPREGGSRVATAPAGAINSSARDLANWMLFQLGDGTFEGKRILSAEALQETHTPQIVVATTPEFRAARQLRYFAGYGLGWQVFDYRGRLLLWHTGGGDGQSVYVGLLPELRFGVTILTNLQGIGLFNVAVAARLFDHVLGEPTRDYASEARGAWDKAQKQRLEEILALKASRLRDTHPSLPLSAYVGTYRDQFGLDIDVALSNGALQLRWAGAQAATLDHWHLDRFWLRWENPYHAERSIFATFVVSPQGAVASLSIDPFGDKIEAHRVPAE